MQLPIQVFATNRRQGVFTFKDSSYASFEHPEFNFFPQEKQHRPPRPVEIQLCSYCVSLQLFNIYRTNMIAASPYIFFVYGGLPVLKMSLPIY